MLNLEDRVNQQVHQCRRQRHQFAPALPPILKHVIQRSSFRADKLKVCGVEHRSYVSWHSGRECCRWPRPDGRIISAPSALQSSRPPPFRLTQYDAFLRPVAQSITSLAVSSRQLHGFMQGFICRAFAGQKPVFQFKFPSRPCHTFTHFSPIKFALMVGRNPRQLRRVIRGGPRHHVVQAVVAGRTSP